MAAKTPRVAQVSRPTLAELHQSVFQPLKPLLFKRLHQILGTNQVQQVPTNSDQMLKIGLKYCAHK